MLMLVNSLMFPVIVAVICNDESFFSDVCFVETAKKTLVSFFIINSLWALLERIFMYNIIPFYVKSTIEYVGEKIIFRSSALWGHGLAGAFVTTMLMMFFLYDESLSLFKKNALFILGFLAILCFNSRFDIVLCGAIYAIFLLSHIFSLKQIGASKRIFLLILALLGVFIGYLAMSKFGFGSRLLEMGLFDENSAGARTKIFDIFKYYDFSDFLLGIDAGSVQKVMSRSGFSALINENILLIFMFRFGLLFLIPLVYFAQKMVQCCMEFYPLRQKLLYGGCFLSIIMTFNSITTRESYFAIFILLLFVYRPKKCKHE
ncbi:MAG: hypothetical protein MJZ26_10210 [Fibrobacter sp.]|nr:hypothetical protein [Fibrobacter sp.]